MTSPRKLNHTRFRGSRMINALPATVVEVPFLVANLKASINTLITR